MTKEKEDAPPSQHDPVGPRAPEEPTALAQWIDANPAFTFMLNQTAATLSAALSEAPQELQIQLAATVVANLLQRAHCHHCAVLVMKQVEGRAMFALHQAQEQLDRLRVQAVDQMRAAQQDPNVPPTTKNRMH